MLIRAKAPLRISFAGGGTDVSPYPELYGGCVLNATIDNFAFGSLRPRHDTKVRLQSADLNLEVEFDSRADVCFDGKLDLVKAALRKLGALNSHGFDIFLHSDAPPGSGLGSSSALMVALVGLVKEYKGFAMDDYEVAEAAYLIERLEMGISGGRQDQYSAAFGGFNFIEFEKEQTIVNPLRIRRDTVNELSHNLLLYYTGTTRRSDQIIDDQTARLKTNVPDTVAALAEQKDLAVAMKNLLLTNRLDQFGELLHHSWETKKKLSSRITNPKIDEFYEEARKKGALGGKITGAGGGGFMMFYCEFEKRQLVAGQLQKMGAVPMEFAFETTGLQTWRANAAVAL